jgi:hypothetical protein
LSEFEARRREASDTADGTIIVADWEYGNEVDPEPEAKSKYDLQNVEATNNVDDEKFGFDFSATSELFNMRFDSSKWVEITSRVDLEWKADCQNSREGVGFIDCTRRYEKLRSEDSEASRDLEYLIDRSANSENVKCTEPVATTENVKWSDTGWDTDSEQAVDWLNKAERTRTSEYAERPDKGNTSDSVWFDDLEIGFEIENLNEFVIKIDNATESE